MSSYESYNNTSRQYDSGRRPIDVCHLATTIRKVGKQKQKEIYELSVLDIGCGTGNYIMNLSKDLNCQFTGFDYSNGMLEEFRAKFQADQNIRCVQGKINQGLPFEDESFDVIIASQILHHLPTKENDWTEVRLCLQEVARVARSGGSVFWLQTQTSEQHMRGFWWNELIPTASSVLANRMPGLEFIAHVLNENGMKVMETRVPDETLISEEVYSTLEGPLDANFRSLDSGWSLVNEEELKAAQQHLRECILKSNDSKYDFFQRKEKERHQFGQTTTIVAIKS